jgi:microcystin-dependent protein
MWKAMLKGALLLHAVLSSTADTEIRSSEGRTGPQDDRPLTPQEYQLLQRLLSDPFSFPIQYKTWLVSYLETSDLSLPISAIQGLQQILGIAGVSSGTLGIFPAGIVLPFAGDFAPVGSKLCDGTMYAQSAESRLFGVIGSKFNLGGEPAGYFRVPDIQERVIVGKGALAYLDTVGKTEGLTRGHRGTRHNHGSHSHIQQRMNFSLTPGSTAYSLNAVGTIDGPSTSTVQVGSGEPFDGPAFVTLNYVITA